MELVLSPCSEISLPAINPWGVVLKPQAYVKRTGQYLCSMSWEGYEEMGRGAIFANYDDAKKGDMLNDVSIIFVRCCPP